MRIWRKIGSSIVPSSILNILHGRETAPDYEADFLAMGSVTYDPPKAKRPNHFLPTTKYSLVQRSAMCATFCVINNSSGPGMNTAHALTAISRQRALAQVRQGYPKAGRKWRRTPLAQQQADAQAYLISHPELVECAQAVVSELKTSATRKKARR